MGMYIIVKTHVILLSSQLMVSPKNEELSKELSGIIMIVKMVKLHQDLKNSLAKKMENQKSRKKREEYLEIIVRKSSTKGITRRIDYSLIRRKNQRCRVLYKVEDITTCLVEYVKYWDEWEVDRYGNANL
ncbi:hypothetical protein Tco_0847607, partial [Tanacetum coccineum]